MSVPRFMIPILYGAISSTLWASDSILLQIENHRPRSMDQVSVIFDLKEITLVSNTDRFSNDLGQFQVKMTPRFVLLKRQVVAYKKMLANRHKATDMVIRNISRALNSSLDGHPKGDSISVSSGGEVYTIPRGHRYFPPLQGIIVDIMDAKKKKCILCATYTKEGESLTRVVYKLGKRPETKTFSKEQFRCHESAEKQWECLDGEFGIFRI